MRKLTHLAMAGLCLLAPAAARAETETKLVPASKFYAFLQTYYGLAANTRDHFHLDYYLFVKPGDVHLVLKRPSGDMPLEIAPNGRLTFVPAPADLATAQVAVTATKDQKIGMGIKLSETLEPAKTLDATALKAGIDQAKLGVKAAAGLMAMVVPDYQRVCFEGATSGQAVLKDGRTQPLKLTMDKGKPAAPGSPCYAPSEQPNATQITLDKVPTGLFIMAK